MKNFLNLLILTILIITTGSCKDNREVQCLEIALPMVVNLNYVDESGKDLLFGDTPLYPTEHLNIYKTIGDKEVPISFSINKEDRFISLNLQEYKNGTFFIVLTADVVDKITYTGKTIPEDPCQSYKVAHLKQGDRNAQYDEQKQIWKFIK
ncbi:hypothetical protein [Sphingobacterium sp. SYP-B4668]|uniref:hypothetical protein n=1 Tax=Sphingobacterium sp. SYP-B4668 TaxID=2996035 RepID=UPI0022DD8AAE|nr:hypothetical protein [Sphingobacterium sp. SYP-B4668]